MEVSGDETAIELVKRKIESNLIHCMVCKLVPLFRRVTLLRGYL